MDKICIIVPNHLSAKIGGAQYQAQCLVDALVESGKYEVYFITRQTGKDYKPDNYKLINISMTSKIRRGRFLLDVPNLYKALIKIKPDYIYQRVGCTFTGVAAFYCKRHDAKMIWHVASDSDVSKNINLQKQRLIQRLEQKILDYGINNADMIVTQTKDQAVRLDESYNRCATSVVPNFHPISNEKIIKTETINVIWIGNLKSVKQPELFIKLAERLSDLPNVKFTMIGMQSNDSRWQKLFEHEISAVDHLEYLGTKEHAEVKRMLACSHILVNTSKWEGFSNTFIEAWMREVPVVTLGVNPDEVFTKNKIGFCALNLDDMAEKVRLLILDENIRSEYAKNASLYSRKNHSISNVSKILDLLK